MTNNSCGDTLSDSEEADFVLLMQAGFLHRSISMEKELHHSTSDEPTKLTYDLIKEITNGFDEERIVGTGAFGKVYRGEYKNGEEIAVKIFRNMSFDCKEFLKEFQNLRGLKHQNVVQLVGFCNESKEVIAEYEGNMVSATEIHTALVFEYIQNGSLQKHISDESTGLNWHTRYGIIKGICQGLKYLREGLKSPVMHLDLKPANILIDDAMVPKIADFGLSRLFGQENTKKTISAVGTLGYLPPEYIELQAISKTFDIFSLGVIIIKIITGHEGYNIIADMPPTKFVKLVHDEWRKRLAKSLMRRQLEVYCYQVKRCIQIALECIKRKPEDRPTIQHIVSTLLESETMIKNLGLQEDPFLDGESTYTGRDFPERQLPGIPAHLNGGKTNISKPSNLGTLPKDLPLDLLRALTDNFSRKKILRGDAFGTVYMGILPDGDVITVKRLAEHSPVSRSIAFHTEVNIMNLPHTNMVRLIGYCYEGKKKVVQINGRYIVADIEEYILCHEYLPKGTLHDNLFEVPCRMDWDTRFKIINGICNGLAFLHRGSIIHMDIKPETIFLDDDMNPKFASFYLSRIFGEIQTRIFTLNVVGSYAYMPPEYLYRGEISNKSDIYSLGLVILEIVTGQKNSSGMNDPSARRFIDNVCRDWTRERIEFVYHSCTAHCVEQVKTCLDLGLACVEIDRRVRPSAEDILGMLNGYGLIRPVLVTSNNLFVEPLQLCFLLEPKRLTSGSLYLRNSSHNRIAFRLVTETPRMYLTKLPLCGIVPPNCTYTLCVTMREHEKAPLSNGDNFLSLQTMGVHRYVILDNPDSVTEFLEMADDKVQEVKVTVGYERPATRSIFKRKQKKQVILRPIEIIDGPNYRQVLSLDMHSTEPWILTSNNRGYVCIWNYQIQAEVHCFEVSREEPVYSAKFVEPEEWLVVGGGDGCIYVYKYDTMKEVTIVKAYGDGARRPVTSLAVHPTHSLVLSASDDEIIKLWDWKNDWQCTRTFEWHNNRVTQLMFDPNDINSFASTSWEGTVKIWNTASGMCIITLDGLHCLHYVTGDNRPILVSGSSEGAAKVWDLQTDNLVSELNGHTGHLNAFWWHPELAVLITGSADGTVHIWKFTDNTYRLEDIIGFNLGSVNGLGYVKTLKRIVVGCEQGVVMMEINLP